MNQILMVNALINFMSVINLARDTVTQKKADEENILLSSDRLGVLGVVS
jgi:hypothetical protein